MSGDTERAQSYVRTGDVEPSSLMSDGSLTPVEKRWILEQAIADLESELRASEENMSSERPGQSAERLREAHEALTRLQKPARTGG